jgi:DNA-binding CsgD family transcriptional regulator
VVDGLFAMQDAPTLEITTAELVRMTLDLVRCDHAGYAEIDLHFQRTKSFFSVPEISRLVEYRADLWRHHMPGHPVLRFRLAHPEVPVVRLSDITDMGSFYESGIYHDLFREVETRNQIVMDLGRDPTDRPGSVIYPLTLGMPLNRSGSDFTDRDMALLACIRRVARPVLRRKRGEYQLRLLDLAHLSPDLRRSLMGLGLTGRQSEVAFWMIKGKSNRDIGTILDIDAQTVRHHSMSIFQRLGVGGRLALQRAVIQSAIGTT